MLVAEAPVDPAAAPPLPPPAANTGGSVAASDTAIVNANVLDLILASKRVMGGLLTADQLWRACQVPLTSAQPGAFSMASSSDSARLGPEPPTATRSSDNPSAAKLSAAVRGRATRGGHAPCYELQRATNKLEDLNRCPPGPCYRTPWTKVSNVGIER